MRQTDKKEKTVKTEVPEIKATNLNIGLSSGEREQKVHKPIRVFMDWTVYRDLFAYADASPVEISGLGRVEMNIGASEIVLSVKELFLLPQVNTGTTTHLDVEAKTAWEMERVKRWKAETLEGDPLNNIRLWWHSHVMMDTFWSGQDNDCIEGLENSSWFLSIVVNKKRSIRARVDIYQPVRMTFDNLPVSTSIEVSPESVAHIAAEVKEKCKEPAPIRYERTPGYMDGDWYGGDQGGYASGKMYCFECNFQHIPPVGRNCTLPKYRSDMGSGSIHCVPCGNIYHATNWKFCKAIFNQPIVDTNKQIGPRSSGLAVQFAPMVAAAIRTACATNTFQPPHKVVRLEQMFKPREWYICFNGDMVQMNGKVIKVSNKVDGIERIMYFGFDPFCDKSEYRTMCNWCQFNHDKTNSHFATWQVPSPLGRKGQ